VAHAVKEGGPETPGMMYRRYRCSSECGLKYNLVPAHAAPPSGTSLTGAVFDQHDVCQGVQSTRQQRYVHLCHRTGRRKRLTRSAETSRKGHCELSKLKQMRRSRQLWTLIAQVSQFSIKRLKCPKLLISGSRVPVALVAGALLALSSYFRL